MKNVGCAVGASDGCTDGAAEGAKGRHSPAGKMATGKIITVGRIRYSKESLCVKATTKMKK